MDELQGEGLNLRPPHDECDELTNCSTLRYWGACHRYCSTLPVFVKTLDKGKWSNLFRFQPLCMVLQPFQSWASGLLRHNEVSFHRQRNNSLHSARWNAQ